jgi:TATA-box binding protein (TBP) (component of TFIID and TFIIIB)
MDQCCLNPRLRISTMTFISHIDSIINLQDVYDRTDINESISYLEYADNEPKGTKKKKVKKRKRDDHKKRKFFYNQVTMHIVLDKIINVKIFNNGGVQMTGLKHYEQTEKILKLLTDLFFEKELIQSKEITSKKIVLINSDFDIGFKIDREKLHRLVSDKEYYSSFEPIIYPGVNIKYYFNEKNPIQNGICQCCSICDGKGLNDNCKKITIAVFKSGKIIITGGQCIQHINTAYEFINTIIHDNKKVLESHY